jgi:hypothetical protein
MKTVTVTRVVFSLALLGPTVYLAPAQTSRPPATPEPAGLTAPIPAAIRSAKSIFISNAGADGGMFPHPFTGDASRGYVQFYNALKEMDEYQLVTDPVKADLVLELHLCAPSGPANANKEKGAADPLPAFRLVIYDRKSHYILWELTQPVKLALKQETHDRNFDEALTNLVADFQALTRPVPPR